MQHKNDYALFRYHSHGQHAAVQEGFVFPDNPGCSLQRKRADAIRGGKFSPDVINDFGSIMDMEEVAPHANCPDILSPYQDR